MQTWQHLSDGRRVLTPEAIREHLRGLFDMRFTVTEARTVLEPWTIPHELTDALETVGKEPGKPDF